MLQYFVMVMQIKLIVVVVVFDMPLVKSRRDKPLSPLLLTPRRVGNVHVLKSNWTKFISHAKSTFAFSSI